jgi:phosphatidylserine decarboxylase
MKSRTPYIIAQEGFKSISIAILVTITLGMIGLCFLSFISLVITAILIYSYRDPERVVNSDDSAIISVCDGKVFHIETLEENLLVSVDTSLFDVSIIRSPIDSKIENIKKINGLQIATSNIKSKILNDRLSFELKNSINVKVEIIAGIFAKGINIFVKDDTNLKRGDRIGLLRDGIVKVYLPKNTRLKVDIGDKVKAGESIIGFLDK